MSRIDITFLLVALLTPESINAEEQAKEKAIVIDRNLRTSEIEPAVYFDIDDPSDPFGDIYAELRSRRASGLANPDMPRPLPEYPAETVTSMMDWGKLEDVFRWDWDDGDRPDNPLASLLAASLR